MTQYYYLICFDEDTKEWIHDCDTESIRLNDKTIWDDEKQAWISNRDSLGNLTKGQLKADELFADGITFLNRISAVRHLKDNDVS
jgi:hypothetical protein